MDNKVVIPVLIDMEILSQLKTALAGKMGVTEYLSKVCARTAYNKISEKVNLKTREGMDYSLWSE